MISRVLAPLLLAPSLLLAFSLPAFALTPEWVDAWRADLAFAADSLPRAHADFHHRLSREDYRAELDSLSARLPGLAQHEVIVELARIIVRVGDGHTRVTFPFDKSAGIVTGHVTTAEPKIPGIVFRHYPIRFGLFGDSLWVTHTDAKHRVLLAGRVLRLGEKTAGEAIRAVEPVVQRDNESQVRNLLPSWLIIAEILAARGVVSDPERLLVEVELPGGGRRTATLAPLVPGTAVVWVEARPAEPRPLSDRAPERAHWFETIEGGAAIYGRVRAVRDDPEGRTLASFADSLLARFESSGARRLILDLRGNDGGDGGLRRPLVQHLIRSRRLGEPGALWALIDRGTFSAAVMLAADLENWTSAILAGEMTGGDPNTFGDSKRIVLPRSGITVRTSSLYWQLTDPRDRRGGITPHLPVAMSFEDWRTNRDPVLAAALAGLDGSTPAALPLHWRGTLAFESHRSAIEIELSSAASAASGTVTVPDWGFKDLALTSGSLGPQGLSAAWTEQGQAWRLEAVPAGSDPVLRLVGAVSWKGRALPLVLEAR